MSDALALDGTFALDDVGPALEVGYTGAFGFDDAATFELALDDEGFALDDNGFALDDEVAFETALDGEVAFETALDDEVAFETALDDEVAFETRDDEGFTLDDALLAIASSSAASGFGVTMVGGAS